MIKKTITYETFDGESVTEDFYFNLSKAELVELEVSKREGFSKAIQAVAESEDGQAIIDAFKRIIMMSYGVKSPDGKRFIKNQELSESFIQTDAYSVLFMELATDAEAAAQFIRGVIPAGLNEQINQLELPTEDVKPAQPKELNEMSREELIEHFQKQGPELG